MKKNLALKAVKEKSRIWLIYRESDKSKDYHLAYSFNAVDSELDSEHIYLYGEPGKAEVFMPPIALNRRKDRWFSELMDRHGNFGLGFMQLNEYGIRNFEAIKASSTIAFR